MILDELVTSTRVHLQERMALKPLAVLQAEVAQLHQNADFIFEAELRKPTISLIAEVKKASPSKGEIVGDFPYLAIAKAYVQAEVTAISVLTEADHFQGDLKYLQAISEATTTPTLRKDFTIDPYMLYEARAAGAQIILLIVAILTDPQLREYLALADELGLSAIVEVHDAQEVARAIDTGARIIGINNRNLKNFTVNLDNTVQLKKLIPTETLVISESGIKTRADVAQVAEVGVNGVLIGETLMRANDKQAVANELRGIE